ncbi:TPA: hypothetical protein HA234_03455 [Candidatus Woesearchaeota archaeon]|nr:hypothetical protein [Candidatus Woesearchaeota archaeon]
MASQIISRLPVLLVEGMESLILSHYSLTKQFLNTIDPDLLEEISKRKALNIFTTAASETPAYAKFLRRNRVKPERIRTIADFESLVPATDKVNYVKQFPFEERCRGGHLPTRGNVDESGGTSGIPTNWIHDFSEESLLFKAVNFEFNYVFGGQKKDYFVLSAWSSGPWATGVKFCELMERVALVKNTTTDPLDIINTLKMFGNKRNYLIGGYPPFVRNLLYDYDDQISWKDYTIDIITGGEGVTLEWVYHLRKKLQKKAKIVSSYGASDIDIGIGFESPLAFFIRETIARNPALKQELFPHNDLPMIFQYNPTTHYITEKKNAEGCPEFEITLLDKHSALPKVKYNLHDAGRKLSFKEMIRAIEKHRPHFWPEFKSKAQGKEEDILHLPFLCVFGRSDGTLSFDGANVHPSDIQECTELHPELQRKINRFKMEKDFDRQHNPLFIIHIELKKNCRGEKRLGQKYEQVLRKELPKVNRDFKESVSKNPKLAPRVKLYAFEHPLFRKDDTKVKNIYIVKKQ